MQNDDLQQDNQANEKAQGEIAPVETAAPAPGADVGRPNTAGMTPNQIINSGLALQQQQAASEPAKDEPTKEE